MRHVTLLCLLALAGAGCQSATVSAPLTGSIGGNEPVQQVEFWHQLAERPVTSNDDAFHGLLLFLDGQDPAKDYAGRVAELKRREMLPEEFNAPANEAVDRGTLAVALVRALDMRGGVLMRLLGPTRRYATRELQFADVFPPSSPGQTFSGSEFLGIIARAENYQERRATGLRAAEDVNEARGAGARGRTQGGAGAQGGAGVPSEVRPEMEPAPGPAEHSPQPGRAP
jgi:hypothetical protein